MDVPRVVDIPSGMGGISYGFKLAGYEIDLGVDLDSDSVKSFRDNLSAPGKVMDMRDFTPSKKDYDIIIVGGPPCQSFSLINTNRNIFDARAQLSLELCRIIHDVQPEAFVFENVMSTPKWLKAAVKEIRGYKVTENVVNSMYYGVAQSRRRRVFIGTRKKHIKINVPLLYEVKTVRDAFTEIPENWGYTNHMPHTVEKFKKFHKKTWTSNYKATFAGTVRLQWDEPACAIVNYKKAQILHPMEPRSITGAEALALQGFPAWYVPCGTETSKAIQIANAVPPGLAKAVATEMRRQVFN